MNSISVVVPAYNAERHLGETLSSILAQTLPPTQILVVDDGSLDQTGRIAADFGPRVTVIRQDNAGESVARNRGIAAADGEWIAFCDSDDVWAPEKLERQIAAFSRQPTALWGFCWYEEFGDSNRLPPLPNVGRDLVRSRLFLVPGVPVLPSCAMVRRLAKTRFPEWTTYSEDAIYFNDLFQEGEVAFLPERLVRYRRHAASGQRRPGAARQTAQSLIRWARERDAQTPGTLLALLEGLTGRLQIAIWKRDWQRVEELRTELLAAWPDGRPVPGILRSQLWPRWMYRLYDRVRRTDPRASAS